MAQQLTPVLYLPNEIIIREGMPGYSMYFISMGVVRILLGVSTPKQREVGTLTTNSFVGEITVISSKGQRRRSTVVSATVLRLEKLTRRSLEVVGKEFPSFL